MIKYTHRHRFTNIIRKGKHLHRLFDRRLHRHFDYTQEEVCAQTQTLAGVSAYTDMVSRDKCMHKHRQLTGYTGVWVGLFQAVRIQIAFRKQ